MKSENTRSSLLIRSISGQNIAAKFVSGSSSGGTVQLRTKGGRSNISCTQDPAGEVTWGYDTKGIFGGGVRYFDRTGPW